MHSPIPKWLFPALLCVALGFPSLAFAHGGGYSGPPATEPPAKKPTIPTPTPGPAGSTGPAAPAGPSAPVGGLKAAGSPSNPLSTPSDDSATWRHWWALNQAPYLQLRARVRASGPLTDSEGQASGRGPRDGGARVSSATIRAVLLPELLLALKTSASTDIQSSCMIALAKIADPEDPEGSSALAREVLREIKTRLTSSNQELAETAAIALGITGSREHIALLAAVLAADLQQLQRLGSPQLGAVSVRVRAFAAYGLGLIGARANEYDRLVINEALRTVLEGEGRGMALADIPAACVTAIGLTPLGIEVGLRDTEESKAGWSPRVMHSRQDQLRYLLSFYANDSIDSLVRAQAPTSMARLLRSPDVLDDFAARIEVVNALILSLKPASEDDDSMQESCVLALGVIGDGDEDPLDVALRSTLMQAAESLNDYQARRFALIALAQAASRPGRGRGDPLHGVHVRESKENARGFLLRALNGKGAARPWAGIALAVLERSLEDAKQPSSADSKVAVRAGLKDARSPEDLGAFAIACGMLRDAEAGEILLEHLQSVRDVEARGFTAIALGMLNERAAMAPILQLAKRSRFQPELLRSSAIALGLLDDKQLIPELIDMLSAATSLASQAAISRALGTIGDSRSIGALMLLLHDTEASDLARAFAVVALGIVADKEDLPWNSRIGLDSNYRANTTSLTDGRCGILDIL